MVGRIKKYLASKINCKRAGCGMNYTRLEALSLHFKWGLLFAMVYSAIDTYIFRGKAPWTFSNKADHLQTKESGHFKI